MPFWKRFLVRLRHFEFWPFSIFYFPTFFYYAYLVLKHRSFFFFSAANPNIEMGGMLGERKSDIFRQIPNEYIPVTILMRAGVSIDEVKLKMKEKGLAFPIILKPDIGERGWRVEKIRNDEQLAFYLESMKVDFLMQEYIDHKLELGIFFIRDPSNGHGEVTSIVRKGFLTVVGDGKKSVKELLQESLRAVLQFDFDSEFYREILPQVPPKGQEMLIEGIGNHCRGTIFYDDGHEIDQDLNRSINNIANNIPEFYFGRFDLKTKSYDDLKDGKNFSILELNGAGSEPGHIYDPKFTLMKAYKDVFWHLRMLSKVSSENRRKGIPYTSFRDGIRKFREIRRYNKAKA